MSSDESVTDWIQAVQAGDEKGAERLWQQYFHALVRLARMKLKETPRRVADEEDAAISAFESFFRGAEQGRFPNLNDRTSLWRLLVVITERKVSNQVKQQFTQKRGGGCVRGNSTMSDSRGGFDNVKGPEPTPEFAMQVAEDYERLLAKLVTERQRRIVELELQGYTDQEIADQLECARITIQRDLKKIRETWNDELND